MSIFTHISSFQTTIQFTLTIEDVEHEIEHTLLFTQRQDESYSVELSVEPYLLRPEFRKAIALRIQELNALAPADVHINAFI